MKDALHDASSSFVQALIRSASADDPPPGAKVRALSRLAAADTSLVIPRGLVGALLLVAVGATLCWGPRCAAHAGPEPTADAWNGAASPECCSGIEGSASPRNDRAGAPSVGSSGEGPSSAGSGG
jgi:hypothetical protein